MKIYVVGHSKNRFLHLDSIREKFLIDQSHEGDNIDHLNPWYCELTGLYYLWKHVNDDIVGLEHYRTYFWKNGHPINEAEIKEELKKGEIICSGWKMPNPLHGGRTVREEFSKVMRSDYVIFLKCLECKNPDFYKIFDEYLNGDQFVCCNMMITKRQILDSYMLFLFDIITDFHNISKPNSYNFRREGWISEFLFGSWIKYTEKKPVFVNINKLKKGLENTEFFVTDPTVEVKINV